MNRREVKIAFTNSEHGALARFWHTFLKDHNLLATLNTRISRTQNRAGLANLTEKERKKLGTIRNLAYSKELSFKTFLYLFKELIRGSALTFNIKLTDVSGNEFYSSYKVSLQSMDEKRGDIVLGNIWLEFLEKNELYAKLPEYIQRVKKRDMTNLSTEQENKLKTISKYAYSESLSFKSIIFLFKELLVGELLVIEIVLRDAIGKDFVSTISLKLNDIIATDSEKGGKDGE